MFLIQLFLPLYDNHCQAFSQADLDQVQTLLIEKFGGVTAYIRSPVKGVWKENDNKSVRDDMIIYEVMTEQLDEKWWRTYRQELCRKFRQEQMIVRAMEIKLL
jgi:hypothetical protein